jgi:hypothetical protein
MPILYSLSMAASLTLIAKRLRASLVTMIAMISVWAVVAVGRFEWTGTSTGGVYAVLAAVVALVLSVQVGKHLIVGGLVTLLIFFLLVALTKLPSIFAMGLGVLVGLLEALRQLLRPTRTGLLGYFVGLALVVPAVLLAIHLFGLVIDGRIRLTGNNFGLGQLAYFDLPFVVSTLLLNQLWLWLSIGLLLWPTNVIRRSMNWNYDFLVAMCVTAMLCALALEASLSGLANSYTYFSGPLYFLASLSLLLVGMRGQLKQRFGVMSLTTTTVLAFSGLLWGISGLTSALWNVVGRVLQIEDVTKLELLKFFTSDRRFGASIAALVVLGFLTLGIRTSTAIVVPLLLSLTVLSFVGLAQTSLDESRTEVSPEQLSQDFGSPIQRQVGNWLRENSQPSDLVATNYLFDELEGSVSDYAFAVWSQREFFVLGPKLGYGTSQLRTAAFELSRSFAEEPSIGNCSQLQGERVQWFIVDLQLTMNREWSLCAELRFSVEQFIVLKLNQDF